MNDQANKQPINREQLQRLVPTNRGELVASSEAIKQGAQWLGDAMACWTAAQQCTQQHPNVQTELHRLAKLCGPVIEQAQRLRGRIRQQQNCEAEPQSTP